MREDREDKPHKKKKWQYEIHAWFGKPIDGVWVRETVATNLRRTYEHHTKSGVEKVEEICYAHHGYRPKFEKEKTTRKSFYFRGARVWRT